MGEIYRELSLSFSVILKLVFPKIVLTLAVTIIEREATTATKVGAC